MRLIRSGGRHGGTRQSLSWVQTSVVGNVHRRVRFGAPERTWDFRSVGRGCVDFEGIIRRLNRLDYRGPLSVEWEDGEMDREHGATESAAFVRRLDFEPSGRAFDAAFSDD